MEAVFGQGFRDYASRVGSFVIGCVGTPRLEEELKPWVFATQERGLLEVTLRLSARQTPGAQADFCTMNFSGAEVGQASVTGKKSIEVKGWPCGIW